jgi:8-oxo-dGTP pyrophosphatase MutT (NUDIX family)
VATAPPPVDPAGLDLDAITDRLARAPIHLEASRPDQPWQAAVALVIAPGDDGLAIAFIQRSERHGDRWSGHMALPGGRRDRGDADLAATAARETDEEIGLALPTPIGRLDDQRGRITKGLVAPFVFALEERPPLRPDPTEVAAADWIGLSFLFDPNNAVSHRYLGVPFPAIEHRRRAIWGLTHRVLDDFAGRLGLTLPRP